MVPTILAEQDSGGQQIELIMLACVGTIHWADPAAI